MAVLFACLSVFIAGSQPDIVAPYLAENCYSLDLKNMDLSIMGEDLDCQVFLSGAQWHGTVYNYELQYSMLTALHKQAGVKYLLLDSGYATAQVFNEYLQTGDFELLRMAMEGTRYNNSSCNEYRLLWEKIYLYNVKQSPQDKIVAIGIDVEYLVDVAINYLNYISDSQFGKHFPVTEYLGDPNALDRYVSALTTAYQEDPSLFTNIFAENLHHFEGILANLADTVAANLSSDFYASREQLMYNNFLGTYQKDPQGKFFAHFTMEHIYQRQVKEGNLADSGRLGTLLAQEGSPLQDKVVSIAAFYHNSEFRFYYGMYENYRVFNEFIIDPLPAIKTASGDITMYRLEGEDSPFTWDIYTVKNPTGGVTTDYYQYLLIIKNSEPTTPNLMPPPQ